jgi:hypothetical protein
MCFNNYFIIGLGIDNANRSAIVINIMGINIWLQVFQPKLLAFPFKTGRRRVINIFFKKAVKFRLQLEYAVGRQISF